MASSEDRGKTLPKITRPTQQIVLMVLICIAVAIGAVFVWPQVQPVFLASPYLNGTIGVVFVVGVLACFFQVFQLFSSVAWLEQAASGATQDEADRPPRLLAAMVGVSRVRGSRLQITAPVAKSVLDSVGTRMEESRDITRYIANLLIFLGLLGTFFGLATTIPAVVETIRSLQPGADEDGLAVFSRLMDGLEDQLGGMGTAFASSLLGLAGSLVVGLLELYAGHGQNRFYREMEEWLASITRVSFASGDSDGGGVDRSAISTVLDHMVDQMETLQSLFTQSEARRAEVDEHMMQLTGTMEALGERMVEGAGDDGATLRLAEAQERLNTVLDEGRMNGGLDEESRMRLRSIDVQLLKLHQDMSTARQTELETLSGDMNELTGAIRDLIRAARPPARRTTTGTGRPTIPRTPGRE